MKNILCDINYNIFWFFIYLISLYVFFFKDSVARLLQEEKVELGEQVLQCQEHVAKSQVNFNQ